MNHKNFENFVKALGDYESLIVTNLDGTVKAVDESFTTITGYVAQEIVGKKIAMIRSPFTSDAVYESIYEKILVDESWKGDFINRKKDGTFFRVEAVIFPLSEHNKICRYGSVWKVRKCLLKEQEIKAEIQDAKGFYVIHNDNKIYTVNSNHPQIPISSLHDTQTLQIFVNSFVDDMCSSKASECSEALLLGKPFEGERIIAVRCPMMSETDTMYFQLFCGFYSDATIFCLKDITTEKHAEINAMHQSRLASAGEMLATIAHQWKQPLNAISSAVIDSKMGMMLGEYSKENCEENMNLIEEQIQFLSSTVNTFTKFLDFHSQMQTFLLIDALNNALQMSTQRIKKRSVRTEIYISQTATVFGSQEELVHIFINLINNAIDAYEGNNTLGLTLSFTSYEKDEHLIVEVADNAGGIDEAVIYKIFDPYFSTKTAQHGTGIGLYIVAKTLKEHFRGDISVSNKNGGALFRISLPLSREN